MCDCCTKFYRHALIKSGIKIMIDFKCSDFLNYKCFCKYCVLSYVIQLYSIECGLVNNMVLFNRMLINSLKLFISLLLLLLIFWITLGFCSVKLFHGLLRLDIYRIPIVALVKFAMILPINWFIWYGFLAHSCVRLTQRGRLGKWSVARVLLWR
jgi:hypothetical protein